MTDWNLKVKEAEAKVKASENRLAELARVNIQYNTEITRLNIARQEAENAFIDDDNRLKAVRSALETEKSNLASVSTSLEEKKRLLDATAEEQLIIICDVEKQVARVKAEIKKLSDVKEELAVDVAELESRRFTLNNRIASQQSTLSESDTRVAIAKKKLASADSELNESYDRLEKFKAISDKQIADAKEELNSLVSRSAELVGCIEGQHRTIEALQSELDRKMRLFNDEQEQRKAELSQRETAVQIAREKNGRDMADIEKQRAGLLSKEKELKLLELKLKDLARKKDIDIQILALS
jgi:chromosome segregation ATPase